ncbi:MAG: sugar phosphate nucleotidyltransferase [Butyrivibrio sp.]|nr:sugar phosphate nucleotidyltransferase [Acetatifactor muris]MCM1558665.1 sugar phosphate nucleotidyltransferase [Butyrivibrio sp.]
MQFIILSGGSGKRLWPLSNDVRSKQFLKMLPGEAGEPESMIMRVYRQIKAVDSQAQVTIATGKKQVSAIRNQLGDKVNICVEPDRRDTFPAICLVASYLKDEQGIPEEEAVVICPVDPYVEIPYFQAMGELARLVEEDRANLVLMGMEPTYPSEKYGYIIPENGEPVSGVSTFREKPDLETARKYLSRGALWNGGVFACRLGYLLKKAHERLDFSDYRDLYEKYTVQEKISFDYAVAEREKSICVLRYGGTWKDIGTWNTFAETMDRMTLGRVTLNETCENTHVVNELNIPVLCMGCKNMIIAASGDGILVSDKEQSSYIKPFVEEMTGQVRYAEKSWGSFTVLDVQEESMTIRVVLKPGNSLHYHSHEHRDEVWTVAKGTGTVLLDGEKRKVSAGDVVSMPAGCKHTVFAETELQLIEVQLGREITVEDKQKFEPVDGLK